MRECCRPFRLDTLSCSRRLQLKEFHFWVCLNESVVKNFCLSHLLILSLWLWGQGFRNSYILYHFLQNSLLSGIPLAGKVIWLRSVNPGWIWVAVVTSVHWSVGFIAIISGEFSFLGVFSGELSFSTVVCKPPWDSHGDTSLAKISLSTGH